MLVGVAARELDGQRGAGAGARRFGAGREGGGRTALGFRRRAGAAGAGAEGEAALGGCARAFGGGRGHEIGRGQVGAAGGRRREDRPRAGGKAKADAGEGKLGQVGDRRGQPTGRGIRLEAPRDLDDHPPCGVFEDQVEGERRRVGVLAGSGQVDGPGEAFAEGRQIGADRPDPRAGRTGGRGIVKARGLAGRRSQADLSGRATLEAGAGRRIDRQAGWKPRRQLAERRGGAAVGLFAGGQA